MIGLLGEIFPLLESSLHFRGARQSLLAGNVANADTPGYRRRDLHFDQLLAERIAEPVRSHPSHLPGPAGTQRSYRVEVGPAGTRPDRNGVDLDRELLESHRNAGAFVDQARILARMTALMRSAMASDV